MPDGDGGDKNVKTLLLEEEMRESYLTYAMSVIVQRALPDARDGLKPSQRRILVAMNDLNLGPRSKYRKCAKIAGDTSGNYHPHGEMVIYPTLVRMAQPFNMRYPLVDGQGNFGSIDGDPPAAMRYTEARLMSSCMELLEDLEKDTVEFLPNYDETRSEPTVLPSKFPNLIVNGSSGIAVGMATSIPPHNLGEVVDALVKVIEEPGVTTDELLKIIPGPDFPTGGLVCGRRAIRTAYETGRGAIVVRARVHEEEGKRGRKRLVITEIPYQVNKTRLIEKVASLHHEGHVRGISDIRDESDREGMRIVIELAREADPGIVLNRLYKHSQLQETFSIIMIALVDGRPRTLSLKDLLVEFKRHRMEVIRRRTRYLLDRALDRIHILQGLRVALDQIDQVIEIIRGSKTTEEASGRLQEEFSLSERQAEAILAMRLRRLTGLERQKLEEEEAKLQDQIRYYREVLAKEDLVLEIIKEDLYELKEKFGDPRLTEITDEVADLAVEDLIALEEVIVTISHEGYIKRMPPSAYRTQQRGGKGVTGADTKQGDFLEHLFTASTHDYILLFTDRGKVYWLKVHDIPALSRTARGRSVVNMVQLSPGESITSFVPVRDFRSGHLLMATAKGKVKRTPLEAYSNPKRTGIIAIKLGSGDRLIGVEVLREGEDILLASKKGKAIRFPSTEEEIRPMGRAAAGVIGIRLKGDDEVVSVVLRGTEESVLTACENGFGKRTPWDEYPIKHRGGQGVVNIVTSARNGDVVRTMGVRNEDDLMLITEKGQVVRTRVRTVSTIGRATQGVRLIQVRPEDRLVSATRVEGAPDQDDRPADDESPPPVPAPADGEAGEPAGDSGPTDA